MNDFETFATVGGLGELHVAGVPFAPGTEVEVVVRPKESGAASAPETTDRLGALMAALDYGRNADPIGPLRRESLFSRSKLH